MSEKTKTIIYIIATIAIVFAFCVLESDRVVQLGL